MSNFYEFLRYYEKVINILFISAKYSCFLCPCFRKKMPERGKHWKNLNFLPRRNSVTIPRKTICQIQRPIISFILLRKSWNPERSKTIFSIGTITNLTWRNLWKREAKITCRRVSPGDLLWSFRQRRSFHQKYTSRIIPRLKIMQKRIHGTKCEYNKHYILYETLHFATCRKNKKVGTISWNILAEGVGEHNVLIHILF